MVAIMKRNKKLKKPGGEYLKTWVGKFQVGNFWVGIHKGGVWLVRIFWMGVFLISLLLSKKCSKIYCLRPVTNYQWRHQYFRFYPLPIISLHCHTLQKRWSFPLNISFVNVTKSVVFCGFGLTYRRDSERKTSFFVHWQQKLVDYKLHITRLSIALWLASWKSFFNAF